MVSAKKMTQTKKENSAILYGKEARYLMVISSVSLVFHVKRSCHLDFPFIIVNIGKTPKINLATMGGATTLFHISNCQGPLEDPGTIIQQG